MHASRQPSRVPSAPADGNARHPGQGIMPLQTELTADGCLWTGAAPVANMRQSTPGKPFGSPDALQELSSPTARKQPGKLSNTEALFDQQLSSDFTTSDEMSDFDVLLTTNPTSIDFLDGRDDVDLTKNAAFESDDKVCDFAAFRPSAFSNQLCLFKQSYEQFWQQEDIKHDAMSLSCCSSRPHEATASSLYRRASFRQGTLQRY